MRDRARAGPRAGCCSSWALLRLRLHRSSADAWACWPRPSRESRATRVAGAEIIAQRADITDRNGRILATNMMTHALYAQPHDHGRPSARGAGAGARSSPTSTQASCCARFTDGRSFMWIEAPLSPEQMQAVHDIGDPGLLFGPREMRLYPNGTLARACAGRRLLRGRRRAFGRGDRHGRASRRRWTTRLRDPAQAASRWQLSHRPDGAGDGRRSARRRA